MRRFPFWLPVVPGLALAMMALALAWSPKWEDVQLPRAGYHNTGIGLQVCLAETDALGNDAVLGTGEIAAFPASTASRDQFAVNASRVLEQIAGPRSPHNLDIAMTQFVKRGTPVESGSVGCICAVAIYDSTGRFYGCNLRACGGCAYCRAKAIK